MNDGLRIDALGTEQMLMYLPGNDSVIHLGDTMRYTGDLLTTVERAVLVARLRAWADHLDPERES
jgi:hypothetical protein